MTVGVLGVDDKLGPVVGAVAGAENVQDAYIYLRDKGLYLVYMLNLYRMYICGIEI